MKESNVCGITPDCHKSFPTREALERHIAETHTGAGVLSKLEQIDPRD